MYVRNYDKYMYIKCREHFIRLYINFQIKDFLQNYNKITDDCFAQCTYTFSNSRLTDDEVINCHVLKV